MVQSSAWQDTLARYRWEDNFLAGPAFEEFLRAEGRRVRSLLGRLGSGADVTLPAGHLVNLLSASS